MMRSGAQLLLFGTLGLALARCSSVEPRRLPAWTEQRTKAVALGEPSLSDEAIFHLDVYQQSQHSQCSAVLITPTLLLTAAHCTTAQWGQLECDTTQLAQALPPSSFQLTNTADLQQAPSSDNFVHLRAVSLFAPEATLCGHDWALLELNEPLTQIVPLSVASVQASGSSYRLVGYGFGHTAGTGEGIRRTSTMLPVACVGRADCEAELIAGIAGASPQTLIDITDGEWAGQAGACPGDSGGPALDAMGQVVGIAARGYADCSLSIFSSLDLDWLRLQVGQNALERSYPLPAWAAQPLDPSAAAGEGGAPEQANSSLGGTSPTNRAGTAGYTSADAGENDPNTTPLPERSAAACSCRVGARRTEPNSLRFWLLLLLSFGALTLRKNRRLL